MPPWLLCGPVCSRNRILHLAGIAALGAGGIVGGGSKIIGWPFLQSCHGVSGDVANIRMNGVTAARRAVMNPVAPQINLGVGVPGEGDLMVKDREVSAKRSIGCSAA